MSMKKVRRKARASLQKRLSKHLKRSRKGKVERAIESSWTVKEFSPEVMQLQDDVLMLKRQIFVMRLNPDCDLKTLKRKENKLCRLQTALQNRKKKNPTISDL